MSDLAAVLFGIVVLAAMVALAGYLLGTLAALLTGTRVRPWSRVGLGLVGVILAGVSAAAWAPSPSVEWLLSLAIAAALLLARRALRRSADLTPGS